MGDDQATAGDGAGDGGRRSTRGRRRRIRPVRTHEGRERRRVRRARGGVVRPADDLRQAEPAPRRLQADPEASRRAVGEVGDAAAERRDEREPLRHRRRHGAHKHGRRQVHARGAGVSVGTGRGRELRVELAGVEEGRVQADAAETNGGCEIR